ncbi:MAG TPA: PRC and DUF2382 domain-containing protein [Chloroflexota bacterium]
MNASQNPAELFGYEVTDTNGTKIGKVDNVWVDDATNELEFVGVKTGWFMGKTHVIPVGNAQISDGTVQVPFGEDQIKDAPSFSGGEELSPEQEDEIYNYYGQERSTTSSPSGLSTSDASASGTDTANAGFSGTAASATGNVGSDATGTDDDQNLTLHEEQLNVGKREVEAGNVRLRKVVHTEHQKVPVELRREDIEIERVPASGDATGDTAFQEQEIDVPLTREEAVVGREARPTEQVRVNKNVQTETQNVGGDVRHEDVETEGTDSGFSGTSGTTRSEGTRDTSY